MKNLDDVVYNMTNSTFEESMKLLFELDDKIKVNNDFYNKRANKKKVAIVYDKDGWAFCNIANEIKNNLKEDFDITIFPVSVFNDNAVRLMLIANQFDLVHCLWRGVLSSLNYDYPRSYIYNMGMTYDEFIDKYVKTANITTSVYDHKFLNDEEFENTKLFAKYVKNYTVSSNILKEIYDKLDIDKKPMAVISDGVDLDLFSPMNLERYDVDKLKSRKIRIGWVGNSQFTDSEGDDDLKGVKNIIKPALNELIQEGYQIEMKFADRKYGYISHEKMPQYYSEIDIYVCASKTEGTPDPILEAMACGVPIISSNVGIVEEALGCMQKKFILKDRSKEELKNKIIELVNNRQMFKDLSNENIKQSKEWSWAKKSELYKDFFDQNLNKWRK